MTNPLAALSPIIVAQLQYPENPTPAERAKYRGRVTKQVVGCTDCELHKSCKPVPFWGPPRARFSVLGGYPDARDEKQGRPFRGAASKLLFALMRDAGIDPIKDAHYCNTVSCWPNTEGKDRAPTPTETLACRGNMLDQLEAAYLPFVVLVGGATVRSFRSDLTLTNHHGQLFVWNDRYVVMPIYHPDAVLRGQSGYKALIREDLKKWHDIVYSGDNPLNYLGERCYRCVQDAVTWDRDGVPMCTEHWKKWGKQWEKERRKWADSAAVQLTF